MQNCRCMRLRANYRDFGSGRERYKDRSCQSIRLIVQYLSWKCSMEARVQTFQSYIVHKAVHLRVHSLVKNRQTERFPGNKKRLAVIDYVTWSHIQLACCTVLLFTWKSCFTNITFVADLFYHVTILWCHIDKTSCCDLALLAGASATYMLE